MFVFLSRYEGFGFTPLEAMAHGAVPIVLDTPVAREVYGDAAWRVADGPALDGRRGRARSAPCSTTPPCAHATAPRAAPVLASYRWADAARRVLACLEEAAGA